MTKNIVIYGGSFNPSTTAHLTIGRHLRDSLPVDEVWYLVSPQNPFKPLTDMASFDDRMAMACLNVAGEERLCVQDIEAVYAHSAGKASIQTGESMRRLRADFPDVRFIVAMGSDNFEQLHLWGAGGSELPQHHPIVVLTRDNDTTKTLTCPSATRFPRLSNVAELATHNGWFLSDGDARGVSATACRAALAIGETPTCMRPEVVRYARDKHLYGPAPDF